MKKLTTIPLPTKATPKPTPTRTKPSGLGWNPRRASTKDDNLALINAARYNKLAGPLSILNTYRPEEG